MGKTTPRCAACQTKDCRGGKDCLALAEAHIALYDDPEVIRLHRAATAIEGRHYCREPRIREVALLAKELGYRRLGLAFCVGLAEEAEIIARILGRDFDVVSACCKLCGITKKTFGLEQIHEETELEVMCNPAGQASVLNDAGCELNIICGLCVGHDMIFTRLSKAPVTTLIAKDRVLAHNPIGAVYCQYLRRELLPK